MRRATRRERVWNWAISSSFSDCSDRRGGSEGRSCGLLVLLPPPLPERLALARAQQLDYVAFLTLLLADEVHRRDHQALERHLLQAGFEDRVTLDGFDWTSPVQVARRGVPPKSRHVRWSELLTYMSS
jgi:hypothetical protein